MTKKYNLYHTLTLLTGLGIFTQLVFLWANYRLNHIFDLVFSASLSQQIFHSKITLLPLIRFVMTQLLIYVAYVALIAYMANSIANLFKLKQQSTYRLGVALWLICTLAVIAANAYYIQYSYFSVLIRHEWLNDKISDGYFLVLLTICCLIIAVALLLTGINLIFDLYRERHLSKQGLVLLVIFSLCGANIYQERMSRPITASAATAAKPNIFIIGLDAFRPDFIEGDTLKPFLDSAVIFSEAYTPLARTFPSWTSILTAKHPLHSHARGNIPDLADVQLNETLAKRLQQVGYETIYATDDSRFNNVNQLFGFDRVIGPPMGVNDFFIGSVNDFPLSNLLVSTWLGKWLFPYSYGNRAAALYYDPNNFQNMLRTALQQRQAKPLFFAVHFCISGWPFYRFGSPHYQFEMDAQLYKNSVGIAELQVKNFLTFLRSSGLLDHAIVVLLSDHGITLGLHGDRLVTAERYQGDKKNLRKIIKADYSDKSGSGIDTSYGYGGDILSLKQSHAILAMRGYGIDLGVPHTVADRVSLMDVSPTLLDVLHLEPFQHGDGQSLKPYLMNANYKLPSTRKFFLETSFTLPEIEKDGISPEKVLTKTIQLYQIDFHSGLVYVRPKVEQTMITAKERGLLEGDWFLVAMPSLREAKLIGPIDGKMILRNYQTPPYHVLVNIKTGAWTTELNGKFANSSPVKQMLNDLRLFYGKESI